MDMMPSSMIAAIAASAAAGKNPWLPLSLIFLFAAPGSVPEGMMDPELQRQLHGLGPVELLWSLGAVFGALAIADSLADKIGFIEKWLVPVSTAWRPFAGVACATIVGVAAASDTPEVESQAVQTASLLASTSIVVLTVSAATLFNWISTMGKTGARLLLNMIPVPGLKLAHSFLDDFFAFAVTIAGFAFGDTLLMPLLLGLYLAVGLITGPLLTRLTWIHFRIGWALVQKGKRAAAGEAGQPPAPPDWVQSYLSENKIEGASVLPAYVFRAPSVGRCRVGHLVLSPHKTVFLTRIMFRRRALSIDASSLARIGLADNSTNRVVTLVSRLTSGALREVNVYLFPALEDEILPAIERGLGEFVRVDIRSESARAALPGFADRDQSVRYSPADRAGDLRVQGLLTIATAIIVGVLTGGVFVPVGTGYFASPLWRRGLLGWAVSGWLALCVVGSMGMAWPAAVLYASLLNIVTLRDITRNSLKARIDGYVDRRAWLPVVASRVWVPSEGLLRPDDRWSETADAPLTDGTWRAIVHAMSQPDLT